MENNVSPWRTFLFLLASGAGIYLIGLLFSDGIQITDDWKVEFPQVDHYFEKGVEYIDVAARLDSLDNSIQLDSIPSPSTDEPLDSALVLSADTIRLDSLAPSIVYSVPKVPETTVPDNLKIQWPTGFEQSLDEFFKEADHSASYGESFRVLHFGDSQIEGDRITGYLRNEWQKIWGGNGPGLVPPVAYTPSASITQKKSPHWLRHSAFNVIDKKLNHKRFGIMATFAHVQEDREGKVFLEFEPSKIGYHKVRTFSRVQLNYGQAPDSTLLRVYDNAKLIDSLYITQKSGLLEWSFKKTPENLRFQFKNCDGLEVYALNFDTPNGIKVDNIAMRGSAGTHFRKIDNELLQYQFDFLNPKLVLLQYGGNTVPNTKSKESAVNYSAWMSSQIKLLKKMIPEAVFILIGPSDMNIKEGEDYVSYPFLEDVNDAMKKAAFDNGCGFWDMYTIMGGENSMHSWVKHDPPLAGSDHVHFTIAGSKRIAKLFNSALMHEYTIYKGKKGA